MWQKEVQTIVYNKTAVVGLVLLLKLKENERQHVSNES